jgi:histidyl-tRNA synthetase
VQTTGQQFGQEISAHESDHQTGQDKPETLAGHEPQDVAGLRAEAYVGTKRFGDQLKYADKRGAAIAVIEGGDERARGEVTLKDLALGTELAKATESRAAWVKDRPAQQSVARAKLVESVRAMLAGRAGGCRGYGSSVQSLSRPE